VGTAGRVAGILRVGVLGAGWAGEGHVAAYSRLPGVEVTGLWSRTKMRAESLAGKLGHADLTVYDDWRSLIGMGKVRRDQHRHCSDAA
jgi:predicted dehydrogenase